MRIAFREGDLDTRAVRDLLEAHLTEMHATSPPESVHALDIDALRSPDISFWSAFEGATLVGCGALKSLAGAAGEIKSMRVVPEARGRGIARCLLRHIEGVANVRGYGSLWLETGSMAYFEAARRLYLSHGFEVCQPFGDYQQDANSVFMSKRLD